MRSTIARGVFLIVGMQFLVPLAAAAAILAATPPPGSRVEVVVAKIIGADGTPIRTSSTFEVVAEQANLKKGDSISKALDERHIEADAQAMALVYTWNPTWSAPTLEGDGSGYLPTLRPKTPNRTLPDGAFVTLTFEPKRKARIAKYHADIDRNIAAVNVRREKDFVSPQLRRTFLARLARTERLKSAVIIAIEGNAIPLHADYLRQVEGDLKALDDFLKKLPTHVDEQVDTGLATLIDALELRAQDLVEVRGPEQALKNLAAIAVAVRVLDSDLRPLPGFRVRYVPEALWNTREANYGEFNQLTPNAAADLIQADYWIYTADPSRGGIAARAKVKVRKPPQSPLMVDLRVGAE